MTCCDDDGGDVGDGGGDDDDADDDDDDADLREVASQVHVILIVTMTLGTTWVDTSNGSLCARIKESSRDPCSKNRHCFTRID